MKRDEVTADSISKAMKDTDGKPREDVKKLAEDKGTMEAASKALTAGDKEKIQAGKLSVDLSELMSNLRNKSRLERTASRNVLGRNCLDIGGVWIDEGFDPKLPVVTVKAQSNAYFRILERHVEIKDVFQLGNYVIWVTPSGTVLAIDANNGKEELSDEEIDKLFVAKK